MVIVCALGVQGSEDHCSIRCCVVEAGRESSPANEFGGPGSLLDGRCWSAIARRTRVWKLRRETLEEHWRNLILRRSDDDDDGASCHTASTRTAQEASQIQNAEAVRAINNLATAQLRKDTPSLVDVNCLGRPKEFSGKEKNFQEMTEAFFAGMIKESEMMLDFFCEKRKKDVSKSSHKNAPTELRAQVTGIANHLGRGRRGPVRAKAAPTLQQRQCKRLGCAASQDR